MKKIETLIRKTQFEDVKNKLHNAGVTFFSHWDVTGVGNEMKGRVYRGVAYNTSAIERKMLSIVVNDDFVEPAVQAIIEAGRTGNIGDGKIFILPVEEAYRIRTGEKGGDTLN